MDKEQIKKEINANTLSKENYKYLFRSTIIKNLIYALILFLVLLFSVINHKNLSRFFNLKSSMGNFNLVLYYLIIIISLAIPLALSIYNLLNLIRNKDWAKKAYKLYNIFDLTQFITMSLAILLFLINNIVTTCNVIGSSMEPNYFDADKILVWCLDNDYEINDVVIFDSTPYDYESSFYIKRVVAADEDVVRYDEIEGKLYVNDSYVEDISMDEYLTLTNTLDYDCGPGMFYEFIIPENQLLVLGDNRDISRDSRTIGLIDKKDVFGKAFFRILPLDNFGIVR